jgi:hypothetical protein
MLSPMRLERFEMEELVIRAKQPGSALEDKVDFSLSTRHGRSATGNQFRLGATLRLKFHEDSPRGFSNLEVAFAGTFTFPPDMSDEMIRHFYPVVAMANLLGMLRGSLAQTTSMFKGGPFQLPLLNLNEITLMNEEAERLLFPAPKSEVIAGAVPARPKKQIAARLKKK